MYKSKFSEDSSPLRRLDSIILEVREYSKQFDKNDDDYEHKLRYRVNSLLNVYNDLYKTRHKIFP